ncbi:MAG: lysophospholipid acyltransferase family protein [Thermodesulfobacteriota bacterium]|nr:lysophospholipid acyltransferase family protein [Thermodesulfobacteriota bacterium]
MKRVLDAIFAIYRPFFFLIVILDTVILGVITIAASFLDPTGNRVHYIGKFWSRLNLLLSGVRVKVVNRHNIAPGRSYVLMSNHQSHYDVWALIAFMPLQLRWVMKIELREIPIFGLGCERMGQIYIDRSNPERAYKSLEAAGDKIRNGASVVFFPEGTRSTDGMLLPFKKGGFKIALAAGVPILPITIRGSRAILPKGSARVKPGTIELVVHEPVPLDGFNLENRTELIQKVRDIIDSGRSKH